jgi:hypothetical protein
MITPKLRTSKIGQLFTTVLLLAFSLMSNSCKKDSSIIPEKVQQPLATFAYEVDCNYCNISYNNNKNETINLVNNMGKWSYTIQNKISFDLKLRITTVHNSYQTIQAYILKNDEVVFGNIGYM